MESFPDSGWITVNDLLVQTESLASTVLTASYCMELWPGCPFQPPDWRWQRAGQLLDERSRRRRRDDDWVARGLKFQAALKKNGGDVQQPRLVRIHPEVLGAYLLHHGEARRRWEVEARLLAGQSDEEIAGRLGVSAEVIGAYEALFYAIRDRLRSSGWVAANVFGVRLYEGFDSSDVELLWKILAYRGGPMTLDALINNDQEKRAPAKNPEVSRPLDMLIEVMTTAVIPENALEFLRLDALVREIDRDEAARSVAAVTGSIVIQSIDVHFGPETLPLVRALYVPDDPDDVDQALEGRRIELSHAG
jgi:hypothetical protein